LGDRATRQSAEGGNAAPFDVRLAHEFYAPLIGPVEAVTKDTRHVLGGAAGGAAVSTVRDREARHGHSPT
jgi:hypothetical protein